MTGRVLVLGAGGMLAASLQRFAHEHDQDDAWTFLTIDDLDITQPVRVAVAIRDHEPDWVINASGYTDVDGAESDAPAAHLLNATAVGDVAKACRTQGARLIHYSTDYVFNGSSDRPWREDDPTGPINEYGRSKLAGELAVRESGVEHLVIRTSWLYAAHGRNFVCTILNRLRATGQARVINDQRGRPTCADDLATITDRLMNSSFRGTIHAANDGETTWYEFACAIRDLGAPGAIVNPCTTSEYPTPATRPRYSTLDLERISGVLGRRPRHWREALADVVKQLDADQGPAPDA